MNNRDDSNEDANARKDDDCLRSPRLIIVNFDIAVVRYLIVVNIYDLTLFISYIAYNIT